MQRRDYLKLAGSAAAGTALATGTVAASQRTLDVVDDLGADNSGNSPIDADVQPHIEDNTRLEFPDGRYLIDNLTTYDVENVTIVGTGDATLVPGDYPTSNDVWIGGSAVRDLRFEGFTLDTGGAGPVVGFGAYDGLVLRDITKVGTHTSTRAPFTFSIWNEDGHGLVENLRATDGDAYGDSVGAAGIYTDAKGAMTFTNCELAGWGDNGLYASNASGTVWVNGGTYENNNISQVRLSSPGSTVKAATIRVDEPRGPGANMRGVRVCDGPGPVDIVDCDIIMERGQGSGGVVTTADGGTTNVRSSRIQVGENYTIPRTDGSITSYGALVRKPYESDPYAGLTVRDTSFTGGGSEGSAILSRRGNTVVDGCCIDQTGDSRDGVWFQTHLGGNTVKDSTIDVTGKTVYRGNASVNVDNIDTSGSCPYPDASNTSSASSTGSSSTESSEDSGESSESSDESSGDLSLAELPLPAGSGRIERPITGTDASNPTAIVYGRYTHPAMESFMGANFPRLVEDFIEPGRLNVEFRNVPVTTDSRYLSTVGVGVWDKEPTNYWGFVEHVLENQETVEYGTISETQSLLEDAGIRNQGWIPWLAKSGKYNDTVGSDEKKAKGYNMIGWDDFPPILEFKGDIAAPQYSYEGGIKTWLERRL